MVIQGAAALTLILLALALRVPRLGETPGWDGDEGYNLEIAWQLAHGRLQAFAVSQSFVQHPILFYALLAPLLTVFGPELAVARALAAVASALGVGAMYFAARANAGTRAALFAALTLAGAHFIVLHNRLAYTYNLLVLWGALTLWCVTRWEQTRRRDWLAGAVLSAALGLLTDQVGIALPLFIALRALPRRRVAAGILMAAVFPALAAALGMLALRPDAVPQDWAMSLARVGAGTPGLSDSPATRLALWLVNYFHLLRAEWWLPLGVVGLLCVAQRTARRRVLALAGLTVVPVFALRELDPFFRTGIPLLVPAALGCGVLLHAGLRAVRETVPGRVPRAVVSALVIVLPLGLELGRSAGAAATTFQTRFDWALVTDQASARLAAAHVNAQARPDDVIVVSPHVGWLYRGRVVDFFQVVAWSGDGIAFYPADLRRSRFAFEPSIAGARFAVVDPFWRRWADASPPLARLILQIDGWPEEFRAGTFSVRRNPLA